jgi:DNA-binding LacI/PurR family transcriptional regulator
MERIKGCKNAFAECEIPDEFLKVYNCEETIESCYTLIKKLLSEKIKIDVFCVWDDRLTIGAYKALYESGVRIPSDIAIVGYDDIEISEYLFPPLTTIRQPKYRIGKEAAKILLKNIESTNDQEIKRVVLKPELIIRNST